ncbi:MAG TPA: SRPBCC family protein [Capillimicrobium sp.]|nr:SRPBCC family protein [Capillimicrobium sp.]
MSADRVPVTVEATARAPVETTFDAIVPIDLAAIFTGYGPLPAVTGVREQTGPWTRAGERRVVQLADGSEAPELLTRVDRPDGFAYVVGPFSGRLAWLVRDVHGDWCFWGDEAAGTTRIRWTYAFAPRGSLARAVVRVVLAPLWRRYAEQALGRAVRAAEACVETGGARG